MIIKKKLNKFPFINLLIKFLNRLIQVVGTISLLIMILLLFHYFNSGMYERFKPSVLVGKIDKIIFNKYLGFSIYQIDKYAKIKVSSLKYIFFENDLENVNIKIDQKNLYNLELQREKKIKGISKEFQSFSRAQLSLKKKNYDIKLRVKGDRVLHWYDKNQTSYKVDIRGIDRLWGMEEFSIQKPITRNYTYEYLFHKFLEFNGLISLKYFFINLNMNDTNQGIYAVEEGFSKELIERNKKRNGPIFGLEEKRGTIFPFVEYDLYSKNFWLSNYPDLTSSAFSKLNNLKSDQINIDQIFDLKKWAKFFAIIDFTNTLHGAISKSVKLYYNPVTGKFEPIGFDGHYGLGNINDFIILDYLDPDNKKCSYLCEEKQWFLRFLKKSDGNLNKEFIGLYLENLKEISSKKNVDLFKAKFSKKIKFYNEQFYSDISKSDKGYYKGIAPFEFNKNILDERSLYIKNRLTEIHSVTNLKLSLNKDQIFFEDVNKFFFKKITIKCGQSQNLELYVMKNQTLTYDENCKYYVGEKIVSLFKNIYINKEDLNLFKNIKNIKEYNLKFEENIYYLKNDLEINNNIFLPENIKLVVEEGVKIKFLDDYVFISEGEIDFKGTSLNPIKIYSENKSGSLILNNNVYNFNNVIFDNLSYPKNKNYILYGGINIINSKINIENTKIQNSNSEDAINIISSKSIINNLKMNKIKADAIDIDFGEVNFSNIYCNEINNDCLDISGGLIKGTKLMTKNVFDKGLSFGESSNGYINNSEFINNKVAIAVKDGSKLYTSHNNMSGNEIDIAIFKKKRAYENSEITILNTKNNKVLKVFLGKKNVFLSNDNYKITELENSRINELLY